jgi:hypothetical protein
MKAAASAKKDIPVLGVHAPGIRLTPFGAALVALAIAVPAGTGIGLLAWLVQSAS